MHPLFACFFGWLAWNFLLFSIEKDKHDADGTLFSMSSYVLKYWDNWTRSLLFVPILLFIGFKTLDLHPLTGDASMEWSDLYYLCSGFAPEVALYLYAKWTK